MPDIISFGELLIDFVPTVTGVTLLEAPAFKVLVVDTTGAGLLKSLLDHPQARQDENLMFDICRYANTVGALPTTQLGVIPALPSGRKVEAFSLPVRIFG